MMKIMARPPWDVCEKKQLVFSCLYARIRGRLDIMCIYLYTFIYITWVCGCPSLSKAYIEFSKYKKPLQCPYYQLILFLQKENHITEKPKLYFMQQPTIPIIPDREKKVVKRQRNSGQILFQ